MSRLTASALAACLTLWFGLADAWLGTARSADPKFGVIRAPSLEQAKQQTFETLNALRADASVLQKVEPLWNPADDRSLLDRVAESFSTADPRVAELFSAVRSPSSPGTVPEFLKDPGLPVFFRANVGLAYARHLVNRRVNEEALEILRSVRPEQVVDPAAYYFYKAVAENRLLLKEEGLQSLERLLNTVADVPERYKVMADLMRREMQNWKDKDLGYVARRMEEVEGRLENARGGPKTQAKQKEIIDLLDKQIEELESQCQAMAAGSGGTNRSSSPLPDSRIMGGAGPGNVDKKKLLKTLEVWGKLPEKEKVKALEAIKRDLPPYYQEAIEGYLKELARGAQK
ncbi:MAG: hypothetical protein NZM31_09030 [Gemmatales bacterium]|nr:hypothetical protein [Gemmatales bacterium]MDW8387136.1 hypothetical protein [Gemmatales bacterium]